MKSFWSPNFLLSFGGTRNDLLAALTNEDPMNINQIVLFNLKNIVLGATTRPTGSNAATYKIGNEGKYLLEGLMNDPINSYLAYLFTTDKNVASGTFGVFKMDFTTSTP